MFVIQSTLFRFKHQTSHEDAGCVYGRQGRNMPFSGTAAEMLPKMTQDPAYSS